MCCFRMRETEMVEALEGVVGRCKELEDLLHESSEVNRELQGQIDRCRCKRNISTGGIRSPLSARKVSAASENTKLLIGERSDMDSVEPTIAHSVPNVVLKELAETESIKSRSAVIAAEARLAMSNILKSPTAEDISLADLAFVDSTDPKFSVGSRISFLWSSSLIPGRQIPWPGTVVETNTSLRCNIPSEILVGGLIDVALGNGSVEKVSYAPGQSFSIHGNRLQIPLGVKPGKSIVWNNIKGGIGFRWYDIQLDKCEHITRAFDAEVREYRETDVIPDKTTLQLLLSSDDVIYKSAKLNSEELLTDIEDKISPHKKGLSSSPRSKHLVKLLWSEKK